MANKPKKKPVPKPQWYKHPLVRKILKFAVLPALLYLLFFTIYSWPWMLHFNTHFFTDQGDGFQNVWNIWWVNKSVTQLHQLPWHTGYLHYPYGTTLIAQTLNPFNGFVGIALLKVFSLVQTYNIMVIFSFIMGGLTMFWLCFNFTRRYWPSFIGGFIFTFSSYHFAHAVGHMQLVSLEWIPLFILLWWKLLTKPRYRTAVAAAVVLLLVLFCDYYYFLYSIALAGLIFIYLAWRRDLPRLKDKQTWRSYLTFIVLAGLMVLPLPAALAITNAKDPLQGSHPELIYSTDFFSAFLDGGFWRFGFLTHWYWRHIRAAAPESSIYLSLSVCVMFVIALWKRAKIHRDILFWVGVAALFALLSLGPRLMVIGYTVNHAPLPYALLEKIIPELKLSGVPVRMMVMTIFAASIITAMVLAKLDLKQRKGQLLFGLFALVLFIELWPAALPNYPTTHPQYVDALTRLPADGGVFDNAAVSESWQLYDQTIDNRPIVLGYISRTPLSVQTKDDTLIKDIQAGKFSELCGLYKVRYYTTPISRPLVGTTFPIVYKDSNAIIYDLKNSPNC